MCDYTKYKSGDTSETGLTQDQPDGASTIRQCLRRGTIHGSKMLQAFHTSDGTLYVLMGITDAKVIREFAERMIRDAMMDVGWLAFGCPQVGKCIGINKLLWTAIDGNPTIDSDSR